jgi:hypothetical protein
MVEAANLNPRIAEEKAALCMQLNRLLHTPPRHACIASIQQTREFKRKHATALSVLRNQRASRQELQSAIVAMQAYH